MGKTVEGGVEGQNRVGCELWKNGGNKDRQKRQANEHSNQWKEWHKGAGEPRGGPRKPGGKACNKARQPATDYKPSLFWGKNSTKLRIR